MPQLLAALLILCLAVNAQAEDSYITRTLNKPVPGGVAVIALGGGTQAPKATYDGKPVLIIKEQEVWRAIVGIPLTVKPGIQRLKSSGRVLEFTVVGKKYPEQRITLTNKRQVNPNPEDQKRIASEQPLQINAYRTFSAFSPSNLLLDKPVNGPLSSKFGVRRFFNGEERNPHAGLDFAVPAGTPVKTPAGGKVILTGNFFFNGNTVFVDHGQGFISMFCHLSKIDTKAGQQLTRGDVIGKVGSTGRSTGPHLHWNVSLNEARVDPAIFIGAFTP